MISNTQLASSRKAPENSYLNRKLNSKYTNGAGILTDPEDHYFQMIDNYMYFYHTGTLLIFPFYPDNVTDSTMVNFQSTNVLSRTAPIYSYENSGPRAVTFGFTVHREMFKNIQYLNTGLKNLALPRENKLSKNLTDDYADIFLNEVQAAAYPVYKASSKMVDPPLVAVRFGNNIFIKGVLMNNVQLQYQLPVLENGKYAMVNFNMTINEIDPYDAETAIALGSYRDGGADIGNAMLSRLATHQYNPQGRAISGGYATRTNMLM